VGMLSCAGTACATPTKAMASKQNTNAEVE